MDFLDAVLALKYPPVNDFTNAEAEKSDDGKGRVWQKHLSGAGAFGHRGNKGSPKEKFFYQLWQGKAACVCATGRS